MERKNQLPLFTIHGKVKAAAYKATFRAFAITKFLDIATLKKAKRAVIEIGTLDAAGLTMTIAAHVHNGAITRISPVAGQRWGKPTEHTQHQSAEHKKIARQALKRVRDEGHRTVKMPIPITQARIDIPIGPIIIVIGWPPDICIIVEEPDGDICEYCLFDPAPICLGPIIIL